MKQIVIGLLIAVFSVYAIGAPFTFEQASFQSHSTSLSGTLVLPADQEIRAAVVFVHGSGKQTRSLPLAKQFATNGIAALVYDKRGVGKSQGHYEGRQSVSEKNIRLLADDAVAALNYLRIHPRLQRIPKGLTGISQAGWIVPIAAQKSQLADFILLWSGPVCKVSEEDIYSKYTADLDGEEVPSYAEALRARTRPYIWPDFLGKDSDPSDSLAQLTIPGLWIFGQQDGSVPVDLSIQRLQKLMDKGHEYEYLLFDEQGHNNIPETFSTAIQWIHQTVAAKD